MLGKRSLWSEALMRPSLWRRSLTIGAVVGFIQVLVNQGDLWLRLAVDRTVIAKTLITPLVAVSVAVISAAASEVHHMQEAIKQSDVKI